MSEEEKIEERPDDHRPPTTDNSEETVEGTSFSSEENKIAEETTQHTTPNIQHNKENMEVHHHGHVHEKKKWKEYVFQFFMLFLAVFCGFLAEYQLEHLIENTREKKYIRSMVQDLKTDTAKLGRNIRTFETNLTRQDSLLKMFYLIDKGYNQTFFRTLIAFKQFPDFIYTDATIQQLKNSGGFRLLRKHKAVDSIMAYDAIVKTALINEADLAREMFVLNHHEEDFFDYLALDKRLIEGTTPQQMEDQKINYLFNSDKITVSKYYNNIRAFNRLYRIVKGNMEGVQIKASRLISFLQNEYHLENE